jgi:hypothetical protein
MGITDCLVRFGCRDEKSRAPRRRSVPNLGDVELQQCRDSRRLLVQLDAHNPDLSHRAVDMLAATSGAAPFVRSEKPHRRAPRGKAELEGDPRRGGARRSSDFRSQLGRTSKAQPLLNHHGVRFAPASAAGAPLSRPLRLLEIFVHGDRRRFIRTCLRRVRKLEGVRRTGIERC